eukprot:gene27459-33134_t
MTGKTDSETAIAIVRRNTEEVQGKGNFAIFDELFSDDFLDHTPQPSMVPDKEGVRGLYAGLRRAFPDFHAVIHWQAADGNLGTFLGIEPTGRKIQFETVDAMRVVGGKITEHWGVANLYSLVGQLGGLPGSKV